MDELEDEKNVPENRSFSQFRRSISSVAAQETNSKAANLISTASNVSTMLIIKESVNDEAP